MRSLLNKFKYLEKNEANYVPLTPLSHLRRASTVFSDRTAIIYGSHRKSYSEYYQRCSQLASALEKIGIKPGDVVATVLPNIPAQAEAHFGIPACGAILNTINTPNYFSHFMKIHKGFDSFSSQVASLYCSVFAQLFSSHCPSYS